LKLIPSAYWLFLVLVASNPKPAHAKISQSVNPSEPASLQRGILRADMSGNHWLVTSSDGQPVPGQTYLFIPTQFLAGAQDGQTVDARIEPSNPRLGRVVRIVGGASQNAQPSLLLEAAKPVVVVVKKAVFRVDMGGNTWAVESSPGQKAASIFIAPNGRNGAEEGDFVAVQLHNRKYVAS